MSDRYTGDLYDRCCDERPELGYRLLPGLIGAQKRIFTVECRVCGNTVENKDATEAMIEWNQRQRGAPTKREG